MCACRCCSLLVRRLPAVTWALNVSECSVARSERCFILFIAVFIQSGFDEQFCLSCFSFLFFSFFCCCCCCCSGRILVNESDETSVDHIYAIGSVHHGCSSSSGLSVHAGTLLARRLYTGENIRVTWLLENLLWFQLWPRDSQAIFLFLCSFKWRKCSRSALPSTQITGIISAIEFIFNSILQFQYFCIFTTKKPKTYITNVRWKI